MSSKVGTYIHIHIHIHIYIYISICFYVYLSIYVYIHVYASLLNPLILRVGCCEASKGVLRLGFGVRLGR